jgi:hypothetical protein
MQLNSSFGCRRGKNHHYYLPTFLKLGVFLPFWFATVYDFQLPGLLRKRGARFFWCILFISYLRLKWVGLAILCWRTGKLGILYAVDDLGHELYENASSF